MSIWSIRGGLEGAREDGTGHPRAVRGRDTLLHARVGAESAPRRLAGPGRGAETRRAKINMPENLTSRQGEGASGAGGGGRWNVVGAKVLFVIVIM